MRNGSSFFWTVRRGRLRVVKATLYDINKAIEAKDLKKCPLEVVFQNSIMRSSRCSVRC